MAIDTSTFETTLDNKIDAATTSDDAKSFLLLAKAVEAVNNAVSSAALSKSNNLSDLLNTTTALTNLGFTSTIAELNYTDGVTSNIQTQLDTKIGAASPTFTGTPAAPTASTGTNTTQIATTAFVQGEVTALVDSAPSTLNTLNELAAALGDDANFSTTVTNSIATKLPLAGGTMTGAIAMGTSKITGLGDPTANQDASTKNYTDTQDATKLSLSGGTMTGDVNLGDNIKAQFGASNDLQIFHSTSDAASIIRDAGTGPLAIQATQLLIQNAAGSANLIKATESGAAELLHSNATKIATTSTGVNITGTAVADSATVNGTLNIEEVIEKVAISATTTGTINTDLLSSAVVFYNVNQTANRTINFRGDSSTTLNSIMAIGETMTCAILMQQGSTAYYLNAYQVDGSSVTPKWQGGSAPTSGNASSIDSYSFTIIKTADATFTVLTSQTQFA